MWVNLLVIFLILFLGHIYSQGSAFYVNSLKNRKKYIIIISIILIAQSGLRNVAVGADTYTYYLYFEEIKETTWAEIFQNFISVYQLGEGKDPGYPLFEKLVQIFTSDNQIFLFVIATLFFTALGQFIFKNTTKLNDAIIAFSIYSVLFYSFFSITGHRQTIATALALFSFEYIKKKKFFPFLILILIASTIHKSTLIFIPFYFICRIKQPKIIFTSILLLFPLFMIYRNWIATFVQSLGGYDDYSTYEGAGTYTFTTMFLAISAVAFFRQKIILKNNINTQYFYNAFALALLFLPLTWINPSMMRIVQFFSIFMLLLIPEIIKSFNSYSFELVMRIKNIVIVILIMLFFKSSWNAPIYGFFWEKMSLGENYINN